MKKYTKDMTVEEVIERLQKGEVIKAENSYTSEIKLIKGMLVRIDSDGDTFLNYDFIMTSETYCWYFEDTEPFQITETGLYKTRDGRKAFISVIDDNDEVTGIIEGNFTQFTWTSHGRRYVNKEVNDDLVSKWEE